ncbi:MAG: anthranilate phosphoribosyltransferase [SAR202 cluster bacterium]|nr:anthranilate phosphoribosyltransferase [SAR202 cluster bacterium]
MIRESIELLVGGKSLTTEQAAATMNEIMSGEATPSQLGAFLTALRMKGETPEEIAGMAKVMREKSLKVNPNGPVIDNCGTGGDGSGAFNVSTTATFVLAGAGVRVAKHGNRAMSGASGSADLYEALGVKIALTPENVEKCLNQVGVAFMFAQAFHPAMKHVGPTRKEIGIRTVFNILGPLTNPAGARSQFMGCANIPLAEKIIKVFEILGADHIILAHGADGVDKVSLGDITHFWELKGGKITEYQTTPEELGFKRVKLADLKVKSAAESAELARGVLAGRPGPARDMVVVNAAAAFVASDRARTLKEGIAMAQKSIDSGAAQKKMEELAKLSQTLA